MSTYEDKNIFFNTSKDIEENAYPENIIEKFRKQKKFTISEPNIKITLTPTQLYFISEEELVDWFIIMYDLYCDVNGKIYNATIPYYISNGQTNQFRGNILYPFACFSEKPAEFCPETTKKDLPEKDYLIKYAINQKLNTSGMIDFHIKSKIVNEQKELELAERIFNDEENVYRLENGLFSISRRIGNPLDLIICLNSDEIFIPKNEKYYRPIFSKKFAYNINCHSIVAENDLEKYSNLYRKYLLETLHDFNICFSKYDIIHMEDITIPIERITKKKFNEKIGICNEYDKNKINVMNYHYISIYLLNLLIDKIKKIKSNLPKEEQGQKLFLLFTKEKINVNLPYFDLLEKLIAQTGTCKSSVGGSYYKKYIKYKNKYLKLKNKT